MGGLWGWWVHCDSFLYLFCGTWKSMQSYDSCSICHFAWVHWLAGETCTDKPVIIILGKGSAKSLQPEADKLCNINITRSKKNQNLSHLNAVDSPNEQINEDSTYLDHTDLLRFVSNCSVSSLWNCPGTMLHRILHAPEVKEVEEAYTDSAQSVTWHGLFKTCLWT